MNRKELKMHYSKIEVQNSPKKRIANCEYKNRNFKKLPMNNIKQGYVISNELLQE